MRTGLLIVGVLLLLMGVLGLVYEGVTYATTEEAIEVGEVEVTYEDDETVEIPKWLSIGALVAGGALTLVGVTRR